MLTNLSKSVNQAAVAFACNGLFTIQGTDSGTDSDSDPIPVVGSKDWNLNLCSVKTSA